MVHTLSFVREKFWIIKVATLCPKVFDLREAQHEANNSWLHCLSTDRQTAFLTSITSDHFLSETEVWSKDMLSFLLKWMTVRCKKKSHSLSTGSLINTLSPFVGQKRQVGQVYSDNSTNFVGVERVGKDELQRLNQHRSTFRKKCVNPTSCGISVLQPQSKGAMHGKY